MKRKTLTTAVMAGLTGVAGMVSVANAVNVNPDGLGQVLLYPYYTARGGNDTLVSVVNTTTAGKAVKIRFIEGMNSREVLDFNIYLSEFDVWTAAVTDLEALGLGDGPGILTSDTTCTAPYIFGDFGGAVEFVNFQYAVGEGETVAGAETADGGPTGIERAASGYIEIIEMGTLEDEGVVDTWVTHDETGVPADCESVVDLWRTPADDAPTDGGGALGTWNENEGVGGDSTFSFNPDGATGGIFGAGSIINVNEGTMFSYNATAIDGFWGDGSTAHENPGNVNPGLGSSDQSISNVFVNGVVETIDWPDSVRAVNATLTLDQLMNEFNIESALGARTEWVLTFPTKRFHVDAAPSGSPFLESGAETPIPPFSETWTVDSPSSCDELSLGFWDREEQTPTPEPGDPGDVIISPPPPTQPPEEEPVFELCREANVIRFSNDLS
ncbi:MAG: hypothetical protein KGY53_12945, partial [Wenzhouxiangellaceae bacterium]|nr:hypothetical protein [Wenzhouxiangellaceae bacterium]